MTMNDECNDEESNGDGSIMKRRRKRRGIRLRMMRVMMIIMWRIRKGKALG